MILVGGVLGDLRQANALFDLAGNVNEAAPISVTGALVAALAISTTVVDTSPFSTNGALVLGNARGVDRDRFCKQFIGYPAGFTGFGPVLARGFPALPASL